MDDSEADTDSPRLAVVIAARDAADTVGAQLDALLVQPCPVPFEVIVVDNASTDGTARLVESRAAGTPRLRLVAAPDGTGAGHARNVGVASSAAPWIAFCDADDIVGEGWVAAMADALADHEFVTGPLELRRLNPPWLQGSRGEYLAAGQPTFEGVFPLASSCNLGIRRDVFDRIGGFDEAFRIGQDAELSMRLWLAGVALHFAPEAVVHYRYRRSRRAVFSQARRFGRAQVAILDLVASAGHRHPRRRNALRRGLWLARKLPMLRTRAGQARWLYVLGTQVGRIEARIR
ncbi:MAG: glycosyltransferase [Acidimicrobiales bacterium]